MRAWMTRETPAGAAAEAPDEVPGPPPPGVPMPQEGHAEEGKEETKSTAVKMSLQEKQEAAKQAEAKVAAMSGAAIRADPSCIGGIDPRAGQPGWIVEGVVARTRPALSGGASALIKHPAIVIVAAPTGGSAEKKRSNENTAVTEQWIVLVTHLYRDADKEVMTMDLTKDRWALCNGQPCFRLVRLVIMQPSPNPCSPLPYPCVPCHTVLALWQPGDLPTLRRDKLHGNGEDGAAQGSRGWVPPLQDAQEGHRDVVRGAVPGPRSPLEGDPYRLCPSEPGGA